MQKCNAVTGLVTVLLLLGCGDDTRNDTGNDMHNGVLGEGWLLEKESHAARFEQLESYLGGFSSAMWETGHRYDVVHAAIAEGNHALADYHWQKIRSAIRNGYTKRPARQANADALFLEGPWNALANALKEAKENEGANGAAVREAFMDARSACMACHVAEDVPFMNDQALFRDSDGF
ncbi:hypothetical protein K8B33_10315 [Alcanivorax sp. JB21]|uniref:hypothetical protein n=1 Tax=Alcanivorax limicola TaxID=2874102 RepID=UPI001CC188EC|nr:hypothetical protein [Alcanivorax limicola]MBZ2189490.1 hypothetical protein [Alcanivorax limicola]